jgi:hypothetical protein
LVLTFVKVLGSRNDTNVRAGTLAKWRVDVFQRLGVKTGTGLASARPHGQLTRRTRVKSSFHVSVLGEGVNRSFAARERNYIMTKVVVASPVNGDHDGRGP